MLPVRCRNRGLPRDKISDLLARVETTAISQHSCSPCTRRGQTIPGKASGLHLLSWCSHVLAAAAPATGRATQLHSKKKKKKRVQEKNKTNQLVFPMAFPHGAVAYPAFSAFPPRAPEHCFSARCVDGVTDAYPSSCVSPRTS